MGNNLCKRDHCDLHTLIIHNRYVRFSLLGIIYNNNVCGFRNGYYIIIIRMLYMYGRLSKKFV